MNRKFFGALTLAAVMTGGCSNRDIASLRQRTTARMASFAEAPPAMESQITDRADRLQAAGRQRQTSRSSRRAIAS